MIIKKAPKWNEILEKPENFPPSPHQHGDSDLLGIDWDKVQNKPFVKSDYEFYIDPDGNDSNEGTQTSPLATITEAINRLPPFLYGDVNIYLNPGTYTENIDVIVGIMGTLTLTAVDTNSPPTINGYLWILNKFGAIQVTYLDINANATSDIWALAKFGAGSAHSETVDIFISHLNLVGNSHTLRILNLTKGTAQVYNITIDGNGGGSVGGIVLEPSLSNSFGRYLTIQNCSRGLYLVGGARFGYLNTTFSNNDTNIVREWSLGGES